MMDQTAVPRDEIDKRAELIRSRLTGIKPDFPTALGMLGLAVLQLRELGVTNSNIREAVELWLAQEQKQVSRVWKPSPTHIKRVVASWLRKGKP